MSLSRSVILLGDVMLGRLIDASVLPFPVAKEYENGRDMTALGQYYHKNLEGLRAGMSKNDYFSRLYGDTKAILDEAGAVLINLECCITNKDKKFHKTFNYRFNPRNVDAGVLHYGRVSFCCLANNHILDYCNEGMIDTLQTLRKANIPFAGAGLNEVEAAAPAQIDAHSPLGKINVISFSDHGCCKIEKFDNKDEWAARRDRGGINYLDIKSLVQDSVKLSEYCNKIKESFEQITNYVSPQLNVVSCHWGGNWEFKISNERRLLARELVQKGSVDLIHGHSSHHIQAIEFIHSPFTNTNVPVIYGCGSFVDDYAIDDKYRNDLAFMYSYSPNYAHEEQPPSKKIGKEKSSFVYCFPIRISKFKVNLIKEEEDDAFIWLLETMSKLCKDVGSKVELMDKVTAPSDLHHLLPFLRVSPL